MPLTTLTFPNDINVSVQVGDIIYYAPADTVNMHDQIMGSIIEFGTVDSINGNNIDVLHFPIVPPPDITDFIMFAKNRIVNMSSLLGYFAQFRISNSSTSKSEMYSLSVNVTESSK
tara:strand:+ start:87 stop:434 length:348 start_codon:yes stop_codon:yes gene_type:complete